MKTRLLHSELKVKGDDDISVNPLMTYATIEKGLEALLTGEKTFYENVEFL